MSLLLVATVAPAAASPAPQADPRAGGAHAAALGLREGLARGLTPDELRARASDALESGTWDLELLTAGHADECDVYGCQSIQPLLAGDLDGDAKDDIFTLERADDRSTVKARSGIDGTVLWSVHVGLDAGYRARAFLGRMDVDGDERPEVIVFERAESAAGVRPTPTIMVGAMLVEQRIRALRPGDGSQLWSTRFDGVSAVVAGHDYVVGLDSMPDATGDSKPDVMVTSLSWAGGLVTSAAVTTVRVISSSDGSEHGRLRLEGHPSIAPAEDLSGDDRGDVAVVDGSTASAYSMDTTSPLWTTQILDQGDGAHPHPMNLLGAATSDVIVESTVYSPSAFGAQHSSH